MGVCVGGVFLFKLPQNAVKGREIFLRFGVEFEINSQQADRLEDKHTNVFMFEDCIHAYVKEQNLPCGLIQEVLLSI